MNARRKEWKNLKVMVNMKTTRKKESQIISTSVVTSPAFKSKASERKAVPVSKLLPKGPKKQKAVVKK